MLHAQSGHTAWTADEVLPRHLRRLAVKLDTHFHVSRAPHQRVYYKQRGEASVHLVALPEDGHVRWVLMSTRGRHGLLDRAASMPGAVQDLRARGQHLRWRSYELFRMQKRYHQGGEVATDETWSWRLGQDAYRAHEAMLVERSRKHDRAALVAHLETLRAMPMFAGVRAQVARLEWESRKLWRKFHPNSEPLAPQSTLPIMTRLPIYGTPAMTLLDLAARHEAERPPAGLPS
ncbi:hypothetical protein PQR02_10955 [Paraburkholderia sediminicola]|uniref:Uncharacterized protein n=1 Tax=Paraburkholderia rhynchosiae TaxID=487049 RepID=A0ACC7NDV2_9BURK